MIPRSVGALTFGLLLLVILTITMAGFDGRSIAGHGILAGLAFAMGCVVREDGERNC